MARVRTAEGSRSASALRFAVYLVALFGGLFLLELFLPETRDAGSGLTRAGLWLAPLGYLVMAVEAAAFTIGPAEVSRRLHAGRVAGLTAGGLVYVLGLHWSHGLPGLTVSAWIASVLAVAYWIESRRSPGRAMLHVLGLKAAFWTLALLMLREG